LNKSQEWFMDADYEMIEAELNSLFETANAKPDIIPLVENTEQQLDENGNPVE